MITHDELMRYLDGELAPERRRAVEEALETSTELKRELALYQRMKTDLAELGADMGTHRTVWDAVSRKLTQPVGWILFLAGTTVWLAYAIYQFLTGGEALWEKLATSAIVVGLVMLALSAVIDRLRDLKTDPYRGVQR